MADTTTQPESPCTRACTLDPNTDTCLGCFRTLTEILNWSNYTAAQKRAVLDLLDARQQERRAEHQRRSNNG